MAGKTIAQCIWIVIMIFVNAWSIMELFAVWDTNTELKIHNYIEIAIIVVEFILLTLYAWVW